MAGNDPWNSITETAVLYRVARGSQPEKRDYPEIGRDIWDVLIKCWEFVPHHRPSIDRVQQELVTPPPYPRRR